MSTLIGNVIDFFAFCPPVLLSPEEYSEDIADYRSHEAFHECLQITWWDHKGSMYQTFVGIIGEVIPPNPGKHRGTPILLYCYGNCEHSHAKGLIDFLYQIHEATGCAIVVWDYPGYGPYAKQPSKQVDETMVKSAYRKWKKIPDNIPLPSEQNTYLSGENVLARIRTKFFGHPFFIWGRSLGTTIAIHLMCQKPSAIERLILVSPLCSAVRLQTGFMWLCLPGDEFTALDEIRKKRGELNLPIYMIYPEKDEIISPKHIEAFLQEINPITTLDVIPNTGHNTVEFHHLKKLITWMKSPLK